MKKLIVLACIGLLCSTGATGQRRNIGKKGSGTSRSVKGEPYDKEWNEVDSLINLGLSRSALAEDSIIYLKAKADGNAAQIVKALMYRLRLVQQFEENDVYHSIYQMNDEIKSSSYPLTPILHSMLAEIYEQYYQQNRWKFAGRTEVVNVKMDDISTWDLTTLFNQILKQHLLALKDSLKMQHTPVNIYDDVISESSEEGRKLRPTLFDFVAHRALRFMMSEEPDVVRPAYKFELNSEDYFKPYTDFSKLNITTNDTLSTKFYAVRILQSLLAFHTGDKNPDALIDDDLKRLSFVREHATTGINDSLYLQALLNLESKFIKYPSSALVSYFVAVFYNEKAGTYDGRKSDVNEWYAKKAMELCKTVIARYPDSYGAEECVALEASIRQKNISFTVEKANPIGKPFRGYLTYKNITRLYLRAIPMDFADYQRAYDQDKIMNKLVKMQPSQAWTIALPADSDYQNHYTDFKIPALPAGFYVILISDSSNFALDTNGMAYQGTWVTNLSFINRGTKDGGYDFFVLDRTTGQPVKNVSVNLWYSNYDYSGGGYKYKKLDTKVSDDKGYFFVKPQKDFTYFDVELINGADKYRTANNSLYMYRQEPYVPGKEIHTSLFTDRAIYRPGQTIYFKGIMISTIGKKSEILPYRQTTVTFYDVNYQKISSLDLTTNAYGSYSGTFIAPTGLLNGEMTISDPNGSVHVSVEEYKRPKFEALFPPITGTYRLNDSVKVMGTAKAYSGANIDGATVKYRVVRNASFPYWWYYWWGYYPSSSEMEITNGVTSTNDTGGYAITFKAIPDFSVPKSSSPTYDYTVYADITDINGETHSGQISVMVAYHALNLDIGIPEKVNKDKMKVFPIVTSNTNGTAEDAQGSIKIYRLKAPDKVFRKRLWDKPDRFLMTMDEFYKDFPNDVYKDEDNKYKWDRGEQVFDAGFDTHRDKELTIDKLQDWKPGYYVVEAHTKDKYGDDVKDLKYFTLYTDKGTELPGATPDFFSVIKDNGEPGEKASFLIGSAEKDVNLMYEVREPGQPVRREWLTLNGEQKKLELPIKEEDRGGFAVHFAWVKNNRVYEHDAAVTVPWTNKELDLKFETFRNKLEPGQKEEWRIHISNKQGAAQAAELMTTLYDESLDAFKPNNWSLSLYGSNYYNLTWDSYLSFGTNTSSLYENHWNPIVEYPASRSYDELNWFGYYMQGYYGGYGMVRESAPTAIAEDKIMTAKPGESGKKPNEMNNFRGARADASSYVVDGMKVTKTETQKTETSTTKSKPDLSQVSARTNFNETAFFYPQLETDSLGNVIVKFTIPEALTRWKMMGLAYTKDLKIGQVYNELVTQKKLMVVPNAPRFFREGDTLIFTSKVTNLAGKNLTGEAQLLLYDAITMKPVNLYVNEGKATEDGARNFAVNAGLSTSLSWKIAIPAGLEALTYKVVAKADDYSDGEEMTLPVLTNRMLVTESLPLPIRGNETKTYRFDKFISQNGGSKTLHNFKLTLEYTANPAWYAVQSLPYLMEYPYECAEQTFARFYANSIASFIANSSPKIKAVFDSWRTQSPDALLSNLEKNQDLKSVMLQETPWVLDAKDESERKQRVGLLFDLNRMGNELDKAMAKLEKMQSPDGAWPWFEGEPDDRYITQYIITGMGHLDHLGIKNVRDNKKVWAMVKRGLSYLDDQINNDYEWIMQHDNHPELDHLGYEQIQYLYARSYFNDCPVEPRDMKAFDYYKGQEQKYWLNKGRYMEGMIALALNRYDDKVIPGRIMKSLKENSLTSEEMGMYWKEDYDGFYWWTAPIEAQALMIEAFDEVAHDTKSVDDLRVWLLKSKQTQNWRTTKATTEACYALLLRGTSWLATEPHVQIKLGSTLVDPKNMPDLKQEAGTGYFKTSWSGSDIKPDMGNITVTKSDSGVSWGAVYWQYFEQLDKITSSKTPLQMVKKLFIEQNTASGPVLQPIDSNTALKVGDKIKVRIEIRVDRDMQYVHMKDMRASGFEPIDVISQYKYQDGLGYYESTGDAATNFFISYLNKGTYVFEYPLRVNNAGSFSNGITSIQCMYAPEFTSNSEGIRVKVK
ncbi:MAG: hypothetical protein HKL88_04950 [Bacteroidia bacterium]|nr:hypothetical protein [Bacteroidia bacterium]